MRFSALAYPGFRNYLLGGFVSQVGSQLQGWTIAWHVYSLTGSSLAVGMLGIVRVVPLLALSFVGGLVADQRDRKKVLLLTQFLLALVSGGLAWVTLGGHVSVLLLYVFAGMAGAIRAFDTPARQSLMVGLVPREVFPNAVGLNGIGWRLSDVIGPALAGILLSTSRFGGPGMCYLINAISFAAFLIAVYKLPPSPALQSERVRNLREALAFVADGYRFVRSTPVVRQSLFIDFWATFFSSADALIPAFAKDILRVGPQGFGLLASASAVGALLAATAMASRKTIVRQGVWVVSAVAVYGIATALFAISPNLSFAFVFLAITGGADMVSTVLRQTIRQLATPDSMRGRMTSFSQLFNISGPQLGDFEAGALARITGERWSVAIGGFACMALAAHYTRAKELRGYEHV